MCDRRRRKTDDITDGINDCKDADIKITAETLQLDIAGSLRKRIRRLHDKVRKAKRQNLSAEPRIKMNNLLLQWKNRLI